MTAESPAIVRSFRVGKRTVTMSMAPPKLGTTAHMTVEWEPNAPRRLKSREWKQYRAGRDSMLAEFAQSNDINVAVVEL